MNDEHVLYDPTAEPRILQTGLAPRLASLEGKRAGILDNSKANAGTLMLAVVVSSFFIHTIRMWGPFSPIHLLSIFTLAMLPLAVWRARQHDVRKHRRAMLGLFVGALVIAGVFTFLPGRIMHAVVFG